MEFNLQDLPYGLLARFNEVANPREMYFLQKANPRWQNLCPVKKIIDLQDIWISLDKRTFWGALMDDPENLRVFHYDRSILYRVRSAVTLCYYSSWTGNIGLLGNFLFDKGLQIDFYKCVVDGALICNTIDQAQAVEPWFSFPKSLVFPNVTPRWLLSLNQVIVEPFFDIELRSNWICDVLGRNFEVFSINLATIKTFNVNRSDFLRFFDTPGINEKVVMIWEFKRTAVIVELEKRIRQLFKDNFEYIVIEGPCTIEFSETDVFIDDTELHNITVPDLYQSVNITIQGTEWSYLIRRINPNIQRGIDTGIVWQTVTDTLPSRFPLVVFIFFFALTLLTLLLYKNTVYYRFLLVTKICDEDVE